MMNDVKYADLLDHLNEMSQAQLANLLTATEDRMTERLDRFHYLCGQVKIYLDTIFQEFPNSKLPLTKTTAGEIDLMDYIVSSDFVEKCEIGD